MSSHYPLTCGVSWGHESRLSGSPSEQTATRPVQPQVHFSNTLSKSVPEKRHLDGYGVRPTPLGRSLSTVSLPENLEAVSGKIAQVARLVGYDFYKIGDYGDGIISTKLRIPILENILAHAKKNGELPTILDFLDNRREHSELDSAPSCYKTGLREEVAATVFFYLHLLLFLHDRGVKDIQNLVSYCHVKTTLHEYWDDLLRRQEVADYLLKSSKKLLEPVDLYNGSEVPFNPTLEKTLLESMDVCVEKLELKYQINPTSTGYRAGSASHQSESSFTTHNLINMLLDFLCLDRQDEWQSKRVVNSLPEKVVAFLDKKFAI